MTPIRGGTQVFASASRSFSTLADAEAYAKGCVSCRDARIIMRTTMVPVKDDHEVSEVLVVDQLPAIK